MSNNDTGIEIKDEKTRVFKNQDLTSHYIHKTLSEILKSSEDIDYVIFYTTEQDLNELSSIDPENGQQYAVVKNGPAYHYYLTENPCYKYALPADQVNIDKKISVYVGKDTYSYGQRVYAER